MTWRRWAALLVGAVLLAAGACAEPVATLVWLHGGGFSAGAGSDVDPRRLALAGPMVVVTANHRLGALGFLALPGLPGSGAFGLLDQQAALGWVQRNAAAFGGDPARVTLAGESAGADGVCAQLASPGAAGLFAGAVLQSGSCAGAGALVAALPGVGPGGDTCKPLAEAERAGVAAARQVRCRDVACLRELPVERLTGITGTYWSPAVGTPVLPARPSEVLAAAPPVPVLAGTTRDEGTLFVGAFLPGGLDDHGRGGLLAAAAGSGGPGSAREVGAAYRPGGRSPARVWADVVTDRAYACPGLRSYAALAARGPVFAYEYADPAAPSPFAALPGDLADGVAHGAEVPSLLDLRPGPPPRSGVDGVLAAWARFVVSGDPGGGWPAWSGDGALFVLTGDGGTVRPAAEVAAAHRCALWGP